MFLFFFPLIISLIFTFPSFIVSSFTYYFLFISFSTHPSFLVLLSLLLHFNFLPISLFLRSIPFLFFSFFSFLIYSSLLIISASFSFHLPLFSHFFTLPSYIPFFQLPVTLIRFLLILFVSFLILFSFPFFLTYLILTPLSFHLSLFSHFYPLSLFIPSFLSATFHFKVLSFLCLIVSSFTSYFSFNSFSTVPSFLVLFSLLLHFNFLYFIVCSLYSFCSFLLYSSLFFTSVYFFFSSFPVFPFLYFSSFHSLRLISFHLNFFLHTFLYCFWSLSSFLDFFILTLTFEEPLRVWVLVFFWLTGEEERCFFCAREAQFTRGLPLQMQLENDHRLIARLRTLFCGVWMRHEGGGVSYAHWKRRRVGGKKTPRTWPNINVDGTTFIY